MVAYGSDYMTRPMDAATIAQMRELWIDYWTREVSAGKRHYYVEVC